MHTIDRLAINDMKMVLNDICTMFISSKLKLEYKSHVSNLTKGIKNPKMNGVKQRIKTKKIFLFFTGIFENVF